MGIERHDAERRQDWVMRGFRQFDAPVSVVVCFDRNLLGNTIAHFDTGAMTYGLVLAAWSRGLGAVINGQGIMQSPVVRDVAGIPEDQVILTCVALGWPDDEFIANSVVSRRRPVEHVDRVLTGLRRVGPWQECFFSKSQNRPCAQIGDDLRPFTSRSVAQPGSALVWGTRGRGFESRRSDHFLKTACCWISAQRVGAEWLPVHTLADPRARCSSR